MAIARSNDASSLGESASRKTSANPLGLGAIPFGVAFLCFKGPMSAGNAAGRGIAAAVFFCAEQTSARIDDRL